MRKIYISSGIPNGACQDRHHDYLNTKFFCERGFHIVVLAKRSPTFHAWLMEFGFGPLTETPPTTHFLWVREFDVIHATICCDDPHSTICI